MDFLGSIPLFQQLPSSYIEEIATVLQFKQLQKLEVLVVSSDEESDLYIVRTGELTRRGLVLGPGHHGTGRELQGAVATKEVHFLVLQSKFSSLLTTTLIWNTNLPHDEISLCERLLQLERNGIDRFLGHTPPNIVLFGQMYGGQLVAQALAAASKSVNPYLYVRSLHSSFLLPGDNSIPVGYQVQRLQDSRSLATRMVTATQKNRTIFTLTASFQRDEDGIDHQLTMPDAPNPEEVLPEEAIFEAYIDDPRIPKAIREVLEANLAKERPMDMRPCDLIDFVEPEACEANARVWFRSKGRLSDDQALHRCVLAYASDWFLLECAFRPHALSKGPDAVFHSSSILILSLDHSIWFHKPIKADKWILFSMDNPRSSHGRALVMGNMFNQNGEMVATVVQQGMMRVRSKL